MFAGPTARQTHTHLRIPPRLGPLLCGLLALALTLSACGGNVDSQLAEIRSLQEAGQFDASIAPLRKLLASASGHPEANYRLGVALVQTGRPTLAVWPLQKAAENPEYAIQAGLLLATTLAGNGANEEAVRATTRVLEIDPDNVTALNSRAHAQIAAGHPEKALEDADRILALRPNDESGVALRGAALIDLGRSEEAEAAFKSLADLAAQGTDQNDAARKCAALATFYRSNEDIKRARETFEKCIAKYPTHPLLQQWVSDFFVDIGANDEAIEIWRNAVEATPEDLGLRARLAEMLAAQGQQKKAEEVLLESVELFDTPEAWRLLANYYRKAGEPTKSREALEQSMERVREVTPAMQFALGDMLVEEGELERAQEIADGLTEPSYKALLNGAILLASDQPEAALAKFDAGLRLWPNNAGARYLAGRAAQEMGDRERALAEYREAVRVGEKETDAALRLAELNYEVGQYKMALQFAERHIRNRPTVDSRAHVIAIRSALALGMIERAEKAAANLRTRYPKDATTYVELALIERKTKGPAAAATVVRESGLDLSDPANNDALRSLAGDLIASDQSVEALAAVDTAIAANPRSAPLLELRARVLSRLGRDDEALAVADKALAIDPDLAAALQTKGTILRRRGDAKGALALFERAAAVEPGTAEYVYLQAQTLLMQGDEARGSELLRQTLAIDAGHVGANNDLAWVLASNGQSLDRALELAQRAVRVGSSADTLDTLGYVYLRKGDAEEAVSVLGKALEARPGSPSIEYRLGVALAAKGDKEEAKAILTKALEAPAFPEADAARAELARLKDS
jgi:tetratricopeptide (TPR) repeat protein